MTAIKAFCQMKFNKPSMLQHIEASRETEVDALNGAVVREGARPWHPNTLQPGHHMDGEKPSGQARSHRTRSEYRLR